MESQSQSSEGRDVPEAVPRPLFRDIRCYCCDYCGICRSKKTLITSHILTHHKEEMDEVGANHSDKEGPKSYTCEDCGATFKKPAYLRQHVQSHSLERPFACPIDDCRSSYRRKDHLTRHLLSHLGKLFKCPNEKCKLEFVYQGNMKRHVKEFHEGICAIEKDQEKHICQEFGCGKVFKFASKLRKHEDSHVKLDSVEAFCAEAGCMKYFTNKECLKAHKQSCHQHTTCNVCGTKQLRKNIKRHFRTHEAESSSEKIKCEFDGCLHTFSTQSNLRQHIKVAHDGIKPFACCFPGCDMRFAYKHVRDKHEKSGCHVYTPGDFVESDEHFRSRPRGGRKRVCPSMESLMRKRITPPIVNLGSEYASQFCSAEEGGETGNGSHI